jgi:hypothetical protein
VRVAGACAVVGGPRISLTDPLAQRPANGFPLTDRCLAGPVIGSRIRLDTAEILVSAVQIRLWTSLSPIVWDHDSKLSDRLALSSLGPTDLARRPRPQHLRVSAGRAATAVVGAQRENVSNREPFC